MLARDVMTKTVTTARPDTLVRDLARTLIEQRISGAPVVDDQGHVVGIVSDSDLLHRAELGTDTRRKSWLSFFADTDALARDYAKSHGMRVADVMSRHVISVAADDELSTVADVLDRNRIKRVPVLEDGRLVGLISRTDLVRALVGLQAPGAQSPGAGVVQERITAELRRQAWLQTSFLNVIVDDGHVDLRGFIASQDQRRALRVLIEGIEGVAAVEDNLRVGLPSFGAA